MTQPQVAVGSPMGEQFSVGSGPKGTSQDRKDLERFAKYFSLKVVQVIVQSRLGEKLNTCSKPTSSGSDWFNLTIEDNDEILDETKRAISSTPLPGQPPLYVEISLQTQEDTLILELWSLSFKQDMVDPNVRILYTVYNRMALLLKSVISVTRVIPAYKLSRVKTSDYKMYYKIYTSDQQRNLSEMLGAEYKHVELGTVGTPFGGLVFDVSYRTRLEIVPVNSTMMIKSDHYGNTGAKEIQTLAETPPLTPVAGERRVRERIPSTASNGTGRTTPLHVVGAFETVRSPPPMSEDSVDPTVPFSNLLKQSVRYKKQKEIQAAQEFAEAVDQLDEVAELKAEVIELTTYGGAVERNPPPDFILVDFKAPFASSPAAGSSTGVMGTPNLDTDPVSFFSQVKEAPLDLASLEANLPNQAIDFTDELSTFEQNLGEYDDFVKKLCSSSSDLHGSSSGSGTQFS